jgi:predicted site-specific integrase-resolvase
MENKFLSPKEVSEIHGIPEKTLANWRSQGKGPAYYKLAGKVKYACVDIETWIETRRVLTADCRE